MRGHEHTKTNVTEPGDGEAGQTAPNPLLAMCFPGAADLANRHRDIAEALETLIHSGDDRSARSAERYLRQLNAIAPSVTLIGQVKAGKTSLLNAMVGQPGLLPADVNPWTSVVTSLHLQSAGAPGPRSARFTFFGADDWDRLTRSGGRVGELAGRTGSEREAEKIRAQVEAMREKTRERLGRRFEMLLGTSHDYAACDPALIERYVCLGDDFDDDGVDLPFDREQGRFADITKSADVGLGLPGLPVPLCLRDTPGVNDTFMMREQITIGAIRDSRLCVVCLSAHQALSSVDMALIRLISNVKSREVVIFVNRIDELSDPVAQCAEIRDTIRQTLTGLQGPADAQILFGSAQWANLALTDRLCDLDPASGDALMAYAEATLPDTDIGQSPQQLVWWLSGVPALYDALWQRLAEGTAQEQLQAVARKAMNLATGLRAAEQADPLRAARESSVSLDVDALEARLDALQRQVSTQFDMAFDGAIDAATARLDRAHHSFLDRATAALVKHLETKGESAPWSYDPAGLRMLLRSAYQVFARQVQGAARDAGDRAAEGIAGLYAEALGTAVDSFVLAAPPPPRLPAPVLIGQTIALDLKGTWWRRWWQRRRGFDAFAPEFLSMIEAETTPIVRALMDTHCRPSADLVRQSLDEFFADQRQALRALAHPPQATQPRQGSSDLQTEALDATLSRLADLAA